MDATCWLYENMRSKYGFYDGESVPYGAEKARELLIQAINERLPADCPVEAYPYNLSSLHNWCLILWRRKGSEQDSEEIANETEPEEVWDILSELEEQDYLGIFPALATTDNDGNFILLTEKD